MNASQYAAKIRTLDARIALLQAQRAELLTRKTLAAATPAKKVAKPKKPSKKPAAKK